MAERFWIRKRPDGRGKPGTRRQKHPEQPLTAGTESTIFFPEKPDLRLPDHKPARGPLPVYPPADSFHVRFALREAETAKEGDPALKCPNCGASVSGAVCSYCGTPAAPETVPEKKTEGRGKRTVLDIFLIVLGALWALVVLAVVIDLQYWRPMELVAALMLAAPGIVLLLVGFRKK